MRKPRCFLAFSNLPSRPVRPIILFAISVSAALHQPPSFAQLPQITANLGGQIVKIEDGIDCLPNCTAEPITSYFAIPDKAHRFLGWDGACRDTIGPLCTLKPDQDFGATASFAKTRMPTSPTKALILLHDEGFKHTVWNEFVKNHFQNRCPVVYGGVILGEDSVNPDNKVHCYRISFGYYHSLSYGESSQGLQGSDQSQNHLAHKQMAYEIQAAVLGVLNRHPKLNFTLIGQNKAAAAAQAFLQTQTAGQGGITGLLALQEPGLNKTKATTSGTLASIGPAAFKLSATPEQDAKIHNALAQLTKSWWLSK